MKRFLAGILVLMMLTLTLPILAEAHCHGKSHRRAVARSNYVPRYRTAAYVQRRPSFYRRHRNIINVGAATAGGALIGGLIGGNRRGMGIGAIAGAGSGALYTYVIKKKKRRY